MCEGVCVTCQGRQVIPTTCTLLYQYCSYASSPLGWAPTRGDIFGAPVIVFSWALHRAKQLLTPLITSVARSMFCCSSKKTISAVADPIEYGFEEITKKEVDAKPPPVSLWSSEETAETATTTEAAVLPSTPDKKLKIPPLEEPNPLNSISMQLGSLFEKVAESARGVIEAVAPSAAPVVAAPSAAAPAPAFETSSESIEEATQTTAPAADASAQAPAANDVRQML